jgi:signal transduction histidine kinase
MATLDTRSATLLIVDDEPANVELLESFLVDGGYQNVTSTTDPRQVLALFETIAPDLVLLDLHMPHLSGFEVMAQLSASRDHEDFLPILVLTADVTPQARERALAEGARDFLTKPFDRIEVLQRIHNLLETRFLHREQLVARRRAEASGQRATFLAEASRLLGSSFDTQTTLSLLANLAVPVLADGCVIRLEGRERWEVRIGGSEEHAGAEWTVSAPMIAAGVEVGELALTRLAGRQPFAPEDVEMIEELAFRAAIAVENARLYREAQEATRTRDEILAVVAHDLRNPIGTIRMAASMLLEGEIEEWQRRPVEIMDGAAERMNRLVEDLLEIRRLESGRLRMTVQPDDPGRLLREAAAMMRPLAAAHAVELAVRIPNDLPLVVMDADRVLQVLSNLLGNAIKFTPAGGTISLVASAAGDELRFAVRDTGPGIPREQLPHLFGRFWQASDADRRGIGLGLSIARGLVEAHGGRIWVESSPGDGATFSFTLPLASPATEGLDRGGGAEAARAPGPGRLEMPTPNA